MEVVLAEGKITSVEDGLKGSKFAATPEFRSPTYSHSPRDHL